MKVVKWLIGVPVALFVFIMVIGTIIEARKTPEQKAAEELAERQRCADAVTSSFGTSTRGYADKQAYDAHVRENCRNFKLPK